MNAVYLIALLAFGQADTPSPEQLATPISPDNAAQVRAVSELHKRVYRILSGHHPGELVFFDFSGPGEVVNDSNFETLRMLAKDRSLVDLVISPDGALVAWNERGSKAYTVEEAASGKRWEIEIGDHPGHAAFSPDGKQLAIGYTFWDPAAEGAGFSEMRIYDTEGKLIRKLEKTGPGALTPIYTADGKTLAVGNRNDVTQIFNAETGALLHRLEKRMTQGIAFSPDGQTLAAGYVEGDVALWEVKSGKVLQESPSTCKELYSVAWSPKGDVMASSGRDGKIVLWEPKKLRKLKELDAAFWVIQVRFTADGARLLSSSSSDHSAKGDRKVTVWSLENSGNR